MNCIGEKTLEFIFKIVDFSFVIGTSISGYIIYQSWGYLSYIIMLNFFLAIIFFFDAQTINSTISIICVEWRRHTQWHYIPIILKIFMVLMALPIHIITAYYYLQTSYIAGCIHILFVLFFVYGYIYIIAQIVLIAIYTYVRSVLSKNSNVSVFNILLMLKVYTHPGLHSFIDIANEKFHITPPTPQAPIDVNTSNVA